MNRLLGCLALIGTLPCAWAVDPAPLPRQIRDAKTVVVSAQGIELGTMDVVYDELRKWGHWNLADDAAKADLTVVDAKSGASLLSLSCRRREINGDSRTGKTLANELKGRFPKDQR